jgi:hypothetical protein
MYDAMSHSITHIHVEKYKRNLHNVKGMFNKQGFLAYKFCVHAFYFSLES